MMHTDGISYEGDILDLGTEQKIGVSHRGAWFRYGEIQLGQGKEKSRLFLRENPDFTEEIKQKVLAAGGFDDLLTGTSGNGPSAKDAADEG